MVIYRTVIWQQPERSKCISTENYRLIRSEHSVQEYSTCFEPALSSFFAFVLVLVVQHASYAMRAKIFVSVILWLHVSLGLELLLVYLRSSENLFHKSTPKHKYFLTNLLSKGFIDAQCTIKCLGIGESVIRMFWTWRTMQVLAKYAKNN